MIRFLITLFLISIAKPGTSQAIGSDTVHYQNAFAELHSMLKGEIPTSFKRAVFVTENAYLGNKLNYEDFYLKRINDLVRLVKVVASSDAESFNHYTYPDKNAVLLSSAIYRVMKDSLYYEDGDQNRRYLKFPFTYDIDDFWGERNWKKMFVTKLLVSQTGNCHSLPALYKILADELDIRSYLSLAPNHTYIKQWSDKTGWYNLELTNGSFPFDAQIKLNSYIKTEAIANGIYMDTLSDKENIAYVITDLAQGFVRRFGVSHVDMPLNWLNVALQYYPDYPNALILKAELQKKQYEQFIKEIADQGPEYFKKMWDDSTRKAKLIALDEAYLKIHNLGYRRMPKEMYLNWLFRIHKDSTHQAHLFKSPQPFEAYDYEVQVVTAGNGENHEFFDLTDVVRIGTVEINVNTGRIEQFIDSNEHDPPDDVISRMYDPALGKWWQVDPLSEKYNNESPYNFTHNNPIRFIDPDGRGPNDVILKGEQKEEALSQLQSSVKGELTLTMNEKGVVTYTQTDPNATLSEGAQQLVAAIDDHTVYVEVTATEKGTDPYGNLIVGGTFIGARQLKHPKTGEDVVMSKQQVKPDHLAAMDDYYEKPGASILHEVTESYQGAKLVQERGINSGNTVNDPNTVFYDAHNAATPALPLEATFYDSKGKQVPYGSPSVVKGVWSGKSPTKAPKALITVTL